MPNTRLTIAYDGTNYAGWQIQKNARAVQGIIEKALRKVLNENVKLIGAGRTDSGVHAKGQVANFKSKKDFTLTALNANLPEDIAIIKIKRVRENFHSRFDAKGKVYRYMILNSRIGDPLARRFCWRVPWPLDVSRMKKEANTLIGKHDFKAFQAKSVIKNTVRTIKRLNIKKKGRFVTIDIEANGFLYNMVRNIVGTLVEIGRGYFPKGSMKRILHSRSRRQAGPTAPAQGLTLLRVLY